MKAVLDQVIELIQSSPQGGESLILYALVSTLRMEKGGYLFMLRKLRDLSPENRQLAYGLIELMANGENQGPAWNAALEAVDAAIKRPPTP